MAGSLPDAWSGLVVLGLFAGILSGTLGIGSGTLLVPALVLLFYLPQKSAQGTALAAMVPMVLVGAVRYRLHPDIDIDVLSVLAVAAGAIAGALVGTELAARLPGHVLRRIFAIFLVVLAARMLLGRASPSDAAPAGEANTANSVHVVSDGRDAR